MSRLERLAMKQKNKKFEHMTLLEKQIIASLSKEGLTSEQIAARVKRTQNTVLKALRDLGVSRWDKLKDRIPPDAILNKTGRPVCYQCSKRLKTRNAAYGYAGKAHFCTITCAAIWAENSFSIRVGGKTHEPLQRTDDEACSAT